MKKPEKRCEILWNKKKQFQCNGCSRLAFCKDIPFNKACDEWEKYLKKYKVVIEMLEAVKKVLNKRR